MADTTTAISDEEIQELRDNFNSFDINRSGWIEEDDLKKALEILGTPKDNYEVKKLMQSIDTNDDGRISFDEYIAWNHQLFIDDMKMKFKEIDLDQNGYLDKTELKEFAMDWDYGVTEEELDQITYEMDINQDGKVDIDEFIIGMASARMGQAYFVVNAELYRKKLEEDFKSMDLDGNGYVDRSELRKHANSICVNISEKALDDLMKGIDDNNDGKISLEEYIASSVSSKLEMKEN